jgi:S-adenosylmethionine-diacylglycerol 3-amino-3-carboxypropyl transferase
VLVITSAGCNALDYALAAPRSVHAVDANPRQTALLELKLAGIRGLDHDDFFQVFGLGAHPRFAHLYRRHLRARLSPAAQAFWDGHQHWFGGRGWRRSLYFRGLSGLVARIFTSYIAARPALRRALDGLFTAPDLDRQRAIYDQQVAPLLWTRHLLWLLSRQATMSLLGVPGAQRDEVRRAHDDGIAGFIRASVANVFRELPVGDNYFWRVYLRGSYAPDCCPRYLTRDGFAALRGGLVDRIIPHTTTVADLLARRDAAPQGYSRYVLLDHMDWMAHRRPDDLRSEWDLLLARARPGARAIFRSAHADAGYLDSVQVAVPGGRRRLNDVLTYDRPLAASLHRRDRVGTYGGFHIADLPGHG